jgi:Transposase DDE domain
VERVLGRGKAATRGDCGQEGQKPAPAKAGGRKRHIVTDTCGLLVGAEVHPADVQDRDGAGLVIEAIHQLFPWLRHLFADSVYNGPKLRDALAKLKAFKLSVPGKVRSLAETPAGAVERSGLPKTVSLPGEPQG